MELTILPYDFTICKLYTTEGVEMNDELFFISKTDEEISLVCKTKDAPSETIKRDDNWKGFRIKGELDFSQIGILAKISSFLAEEKIGIFVVSTYNTDYVFVKKESFNNALKALTDNGYTFS